jgi:hypothetical protein
MAENAGNPEYDYLLGRAALANQQANLAVFALERVVMTRPSEAMPRLTLARAYMELGEYDQASTELNALHNYTLSADVQRISSHYQQQIKRAKLSQQRQYHVFVNAAAGYDSNANSATEIDQFLGTNLSTDSKALSSNVSQLSLATQARIPLNKTVQWNASAQLFKYDYSDVSFANTSGMAISSGLKFKSSRNSHEQIQLQAVHTDVDEKLNSRQFHLQLSHQHQLNKSHHLNISAKAGQTRYRADYANKDVQQISSGLQYRFRATTTLLSSLSLIYGEDQPLQDNSSYGRQFSAAQAGLTWKQGRTHTLASLNYMDSNYDTAVFGLDRHDANIGASIKLNIQLNSKWVIGPSISYARNHSSVDLYDYKRNQATFFVRHQLI